VAELRSASRARASELVFLKMPAVEVSSSMVRERAVRGEPLEALVGADVASYISENGLYRAGQGGGR
jgi:nicotinic acid mononucleotide adenylyltransferase